MELADRNLSLVCRVRGKLCALALEHVVETMRPLPTEAMAEAPPFLRGLAVIRGSPVPVVDAARLLGEGEAEPGRFVTLRVGLRRMALAVCGVEGVRALPAASLQQMPPLLHEVGADVLSALALLDAELLTVLQASRILSPSDIALHLTPRKAA